MKIIIFLFSSSHLQFSTSHLSVSQSYAADSAPSSAPERQCRFFCHEPGATTVRQRRRFPARQTAMLPLTIAFSGCNPKARQCRQRLAGTRFADQRQHFAFFDGKRDIFDGGRRCRSEAIDCLWKAMSWVNRLPRVKRITYRFGNKNNQHQHQRDGDKAGKAQPRRLRVVLALQQ